MNDRTAPDPPQQNLSSKLVQFPMEASITKKHPASTRTHWLIAALLSVIVVIAVAIIWWTLGARGSIQYTSVPAMRGAVTRAVTATGTVNPELNILIGTYVSGVIQELYCDYNTEVKTGQRCAKIDPRPYQTVVDQNKANLAVAKAQLEKDKAALEYAKVTLDRNALLVKTNSVSKDVYDNAKSAYDQAVAQITFDEATIQQRQAELASAQVNLDYTDIISPVDGTVVSRNVTMGQTVAASFQTPTLFVIASDLKKMEVDTNISESDVGGIKVGQKSTFTVDAFPKRTFQGTVSQVRQSPQTVQNVVTYDIIVTVNNEDLALKPGLTAATRVIVERRDDVIRVPNAALRYRPSGVQQYSASDQAQIWVLRDGEPAAISVVTGLDDDSFTEIVSGDVKPGDQVVTSELSVASTAAMPRLRF